MKIMPGPSATVGLVIPSLAVSCLGALSALTNGAMGVVIIGTLVPVPWFDVVELETPCGDLYGLELKKSESTFEVDVRGDDGIIRGQGRLVYELCIHASKPNYGEGLLSTRDRAAMGQGGISAFDQAAMGQGGTLLQICISVY